jgi:hypothetical protein
MAATRAAKFREETSKKATRPKRRRWFGYSGPARAPQALCCIAQWRVARFSPPHIGFQAFDFRIGKTEMVSDFMH